MEYASLYVTNVQCEMCDAKDLQIFSIATVKATVTPDIEVICACFLGGHVCMVARLNAFTDAFCILHSRE